MTRFDHIGWYGAIIANIYAAADKPEQMWIFTIIAILAFIAAYFERNQ